MAGRVGVKPSEESIISSGVVSVALNCAALACPSADGEEPLDEEEGAGPVSPTFAGKSRPAIAIRLRSAMSPSTCISDPNAAVSKARCAVTWPGRIRYPSMRPLPCWDIKARVVSGRDFQKSAAPSSQNGNSSPFRRRNRCGGLSRTPANKTRRPA